LEEIVAQSRVLFVDHYGGAATVRAIRAARRLGIPVVADLERSNVPDFDAILRGTTHRILSERFAAQLTGAADPASAAHELLTDNAEVAIVTCGKAGGWVCSREDPVSRRFSAFPVEAVDTTGCGDTFHGVYAAELALNTDLSGRLRRSAAAAGLKAGQAGAQHGIPDRAALDRFLASRDDTASAGGSG
jgi:sugar/nucleoside kinase (ribokinase family)